MQLRALDVALQRRLLARSAKSVMLTGLRIRSHHVEVGVALTLAELDSGLFRVRIDRTTDAERAYLRAMAMLGPGPHPSASVAQALGKRTQQTATVRDSLIKRGLCYAPRWGQVAFTVPMFDEFMRRWLP